MLALSCAILFAASAVVAAAVAAGPSVCLQPNGATSFHAEPVDVPWGSGAISVGAEIGFPAADDAQLLFNVPIAGDDALADLRGCERVVLDVDGEHVEIGGRSTGSGGLKLSDFLGPMPRANENLWAARPRQPAREFGVCDACLATCGGGSCALADVRWHWRPRYSGVGIRIARDVLGRIAHAHTVTGEYCGRRVELTAPALAKISAAFDASARTDIDVRELLRLPSTSSGADATRGGCARLASTTP